MKKSNLHKKHKYNREYFSAILIKSEVFTRSRRNMAESARVAPKQGATQLLNFPIK